MTDAPSLPLDLALHRPLAIARSYSELQAALVARVAELRITHQVVDSISGLQDGYSSKILAPTAIRSLGRVSMGALLGALGVALIIAEDPAALERVRHRLVRRHKRRPPHASDDVLTRAERARRSAAVRCGDSDWGRALALRRMIVQSPRTRRTIARIAAQTRWRKRDEAAP